MFNRQKWGCGYAYKKPTSKIYSLLIAALIIFIGLVYLFEVQIKPIVQTIASQRAHLAVVKLINEAVYNQLGQGLSYQQLINVHKDETGQIVLMQPDTVKISRLATGIAQKLEESVGNLNTQGILIPIGLLTGLTLAADLGPNIKVNILPIGEATVNVRDEFVAAGINQTKHRVVFDITVDVGIIIPFSTAKTEIKSSLPIVESIIVGPIPDTYLNWQKEAGSLQNSGQNNQSQVEAKQDLVGLRGLLAD